MSKFKSKYGNCPMYHTVSILGGKWKWIILWKIYQNENIRYNKLKFLLQPIADKTLALQLKELEADELVHREQYNEVPIRVEYSLTEKGKSLIPILEQMYNWGVAQISSHDEKMAE